jgi:hypothetical protein
MRSMMNTLKLLSVVVSISLLGLTLVAASRPEQKELTPERFEQLSDEEYYDFILDNIASGGVERDDIPPIDAPDFVKARDVDFMKDREIVFGVRLGEQAFAFPKKVLYWHEIVNFELAEQRYSVTHCPLTGSVIGFLDRNLGVSGDLFNNNLVMYDRETDSLIPQILETGINRGLRGRKLRNFPVTVTTWEQWKTGHPDTLLLSLDTGHERDYDRNPYPGYETALRLWFPVSATSDRFNSKEVMVAFKIDSGYFALSKKNFIRKNRTQPVIYEVGGRRVRVELDERFGDLQVTLLDTSGKEEKPLSSFEVFWFAWYAYFPTTVVLE